MIRDAITGKPINETEIVKKAQNGDREAFSELVLSYRVAVINVVYRVCNDIHIAEDAAQIAFIRVWQNLSQYRYQSSFRSWLFRIAVNSAIDMLRRERPVVDIEQVALAAKSPIGSELEKRQQKEILQDAISKLPEASRIVLALREFHEMSYQEISDTLDIPIGTVMSRLSYARKKLLYALQPLMEDL